MGVFRFPSTFTFIFRAFASIEGIGKGLDSDFDIGKLSQPFVEAFTQKEAGYGSEFEAELAKISKGTGLNLPDINTAITSPRKIAYLEETVRAIEQGTLKIRVRSLENERSLERMALQQQATSSMLMAGLALNVGVGLSGPAAWVGYAGAAGLGAKAI